MTITLFTHDTWIRNFKSNGLDNLCDMVLASFVLSLGYAGRSKKFTHILSTQALLHVFSSSPFGKSRLPHKMVVTYTSYMAAGFQGEHTNSSDKGKYESLTAQA